LAWTKRWATVRSSVTKSFGPIRSDVAADASAVATFAYRDRIERERVAGNSPRFREVSLEERHSLCQLKQSAATVYTPHSAGANSCRG